MRRKGGDVVEGTVGELLQLLCDSPPPLHAGGAAEGVLQLLQLLQLRWRWPTTYIIIPHAGGEQCLMAG